MLPKDLQIPEQLHFKAYFPIFLTKNWRKPGVWEIQKNYGKQAFVFQLNNCTFAAR
jgi:hypothetical protein